MISDVHRNPLKIAITTLGCKVNQCDSAAIRESLTENGYEMVPFSSLADVYIVNSCVVTAKTESQSRQLIRRVLRTSNHCRVIVTGCYAQKEPGDIASLDDRVQVLGNREKKDIALFIKNISRECAPGRLNVSDITAEKFFSTPACSRFLDRTRAFLKIQDGCNARCSYCIVPSVRGAGRSLPPREVKNRLISLVDSGHQEVVLTGIHLGDYGADLRPVTDLVALLTALENDMGLSSCRLRLSSIEPKEFSDRLIRLMARSDMICPHVHIPLQSADSDILKAMRRPYTPVEFRSLMERLIKRIPDLNIGTDLIAGFPGESEERFQASMEFVKDLPVAYLHVFPYSPRPGTDAARFGDQVAEVHKKERVRLLRRVSNEKKQAFYREYIGRRLRVLVEGRREKTTGLLTGVSQNYIPLLIEGKDDTMGKTIEVDVSEIVDGRVYAIKRGSSPD